MSLISDIFAIVNGFLEGFHGFFISEALRLHQTNGIKMKIGNVSYTTVVVYSRDDQEVGFLASKYHPKTSLKFLSKLAGCIG